MVPDSEGRGTTAEEGERPRLCDRRGGHGRCEGEVFMARSGAWDGRRRRPCVAGEGKGGAFPGRVEL